MLNIKAIQRIDTENEGPFQSINFCVQAMTASNGSIRIIPGNENCHLKLGHRYHPYMELATHVCAYSKVRHPSTIGGNAYPGTRKCSIFSAGWHDKKAYIYDDFRVPLDCRARISSTELPTTAPSIAASKAASEESPQGHALSFPDEP